MLENPDGARALPEDVGDLAGVELTDDPQQHDVGLVRRQEFDDATADVVGAEGVESRGFGVVGSRDGGELLSGGGVGLATGATAAEVHHSAAADREHPATEGRLVAFELRQVPTDAEPHFRRQILGVARLDGTQVGEQRGLQVPVERSDGVLSPTPGPSQ